MGSALISTRFLKTSDTSARTLEKWKNNRKHGKVPIQDFKNLKIHYLCPFVENIGNMYLNAFKKTLRKTYFQNIGKANKNNQNGHTRLQKWESLVPCPFSWNIGETNDHKKVQFGKKHNIRKILANTQINTNTMLDEKKLQTLEQSAVITGVEEMCYLASRCWGDVLSTKMLRGCGVMQTGVESMRYQANRCWGDGQANQCWGCWGGVITQTRVAGMRYRAN